MRFYCLRRLRRVGVLGVLVVSVVLASGALYAESSHIPAQQLVKGKTASIETVYDIGDVAISDNTICDFMITDGRREIYLNPRKEGVAALTVWDTDGGKRDMVPVEVYASDLLGIVSEARALLGDSNVDVELKGRRVLISGRATSKVAMEQVASLASRHPEIENNVQMSGEVLETIAERAAAAIATPGIRVRGVRGRLILEGVVYSSAAARRAADIAKLYDPDIVNLLDVRETGRRPGEERLIKLDFYFMEVKKEALRSLGVRWAPGSMPKNQPSGEGGSGLLDGITNFGSTIIGFVFNLLPKLKLLRERGEARVLDNATFIVKSGEAADFFNGTQVPYYSGEQVVFKDVGVKIHAEPIAAGASIDMVVNATLSSLAANIEGGIDTRAISTSAYIQADQSVVLANMVSNRDVKTYNKKPSDIDTSSALFDLALSKDFQSGRSEFVLFIKPTVLEQASEAEEELREYLSMEEDMVAERSKKEYREFADKRGRVPKAEYLPRKARKGKVW